MADEKGGPATDHPHGSTGDGAQEHDHMDNSLSYDEKESPRLEPITKIKTSASRQSRATSRRFSRASRGNAAAASDGSSTYSNDTDPLSPLENALSRADHDAEHQEAQEGIERVRTGATASSAWSRPPDFEVTFDSDSNGADPRHPRDWTMPYRIWAIFSVSYSTWVVILYSTSYTATLSGLMAEFDEPSETIVTLGVTTYLLGLAAGSLIVAPMSELFGRRPVYLLCLSVSTLLIIPCALASSLAEIIVVRFFGALFGAVMICNGAGTIADISTEDDRALYMSLWSIAPLNGPVTGPLIGGFVYQYLGWRWDNWLVLILTGAAVILMTTVRETYAPVLLKQKAAKRRKDEDDERYWCQYDSAKSTAQLMKVNLSRPFVLSFTEPILWFFNIWISVIYGILYLCFVAYPIVFEQERGWGPGETGLSFIGIGIGTMVAICLEPVWRKLINSHAKDPDTGRVAPEASACIMSIGAVLTPIGQLVFSWTCLPTTIHWAVPIAFGIPFGCGNTLCFIYGSNYLAGAYGYYAASALAGNAVMRSLFGATLPLAGPTMYAALTPQWAGTLLGLMEVVLIPIPIIFYRYGERIRARSTVIRQMREEQAKNDRKRARLAAKQLREAGGGGGAAPETVVVNNEGGQETGEAGVANGKSTTAVTENRDVEKAAE
ncbi:hypothetical protein VSDG_05350 [Cytospora chrysosperma]|uniref:Major facilitator superfamily (MFS) profile domain-containing protein n=1 Tax=Cytospora chrysosperma TaxID=252740 RepID=A0A423VWW4_CYTCH|nr:hypothetical protein VSDG_05350 [Valsa sordida]